MLKAAGNREISRFFPPGSVPPYFDWLQALSFFNYALEALIVNEVNGLTLRENKFGLQIDVSSRMDPIKCLADKVPADPGARCNGAPDVWLQCPRILVGYSQAFRLFRWVDFVCLFVVAYLCQGAAVAVYRELLRSLISARF